MMRGLLLFAHGARDSRWAIPFEAVAERVRERSSGVPVELAFLEFMAPGLVEAGQRLAAAGCTQVEVVPLFLGAGGHVRRDVPELLAALEETHPDVHWNLHLAVGELDSVIEAMAVAAVTFLLDTPHLG